MGLFKQEDEFSSINNTSNNLLDLEGKQPLEYFYRNINPGFGGFEIRYFDVIYAVDLSTIKTLSENYGSDLESIDISEPPTYNQFMRKSDIDVEKFYDCSFRIVNKFIERENEIILPRIYFISYDEKYLKTNDPIGVLLNPIPSINIMRVDPISNQDVDHAYKISSYTIKNSEYIEYLKDLENSTDPDIDRINHIKIWDTTTIVYENKFAILLDKCKCLFNGYKDNNTELINLFDKIKSNSQNNIFTDYLKSLLNDKNIYIFKRHEILSHQDSYSKESVSIYSSVNDSYLIDHGSKYEYYNHDKYVEVDDIRDMVKNSNIIEDRLPIVINKNGANIQLLSIIILLLAISIIIYTVLLNFS